MTRYEVGEKQEDYVHHKLREKQVTRQKTVVSYTECCYKIL